MTCNCGSKLNFESCCEPFISGATAPETAEALMRSRYTAYARQEIDYIVQTLIASERPALDTAEIAKWSKESDWQGLEIVSTNEGGLSDENGQVEFIARYALAGKLHEHHEVASFEKSGGKWYFSDGKMIGAEPIRREEPKVGRNDPCPCGSGKKYKKCCAKV